MYTCRYTCTCIPIPSSSCTVRISVLTEHDQVTEVSLDLMKTTLPYQYNFTEWLSLSWCDEVAYIITWIIHLPICISNIHIKYSISRKRHPPDVVKVHILLHEKFTMCTYIILRICSTLRKCPSSHSYTWDRRLPHSSGQAGGHFITVHADMSIHPPT